MATTRSAIVTAYGSPPTLQTVPLSPPASHEVQIRLLATGQHQIVRSRAAGTHFSSGPLPHTVGVDGTGIITSLPSSTPSSPTPTLSIGQAVYFLTFKTGGSFSTTLNVPLDSVIPLPETADPVQVAALLNPAMSSWMALRTRTSGLKKGFTVVIMGVTSASGSIAIELCRHLGAGKVIGIARNASKLAELELDLAIQLQPKVEDTDYSPLKGIEVDVVLDYVYAAPMAHFLGSLKQKGMVQYVQIGSLGGLEMELPSRVLRSGDLVMRGAAPGSWSFTQLGRELQGLVEATARLGRREVREVRLEQVEERWGDDVGGRTVYVP